MNNTHSTSLERFTHIGIGIALLSMLLLIPFNNIQFIILAGFPIGFSILALLFKKPFKFNFISLDYCWFLFLGLGLVSFLWATNPALVWYPLFGWMALFAIMLIFRKVSESEKFQHRLSILFIILFVVTFVQHMLAVHLDITFLDKNWNNFLSRNSNVTTCYLIALFPFVLLRPTRFQFFRFAKLFFSILVLNILFLANVKVAIISFLVVLLYYFWSKKRKLLFVLFSFGVFGLFILNGLISYDEWMETNFNALYKKDNFSRIDLLKLSIDSIKENLLLGVGLGNWDANVYSQDLSQMTGLNASSEFYRLKSQALIAKVAVELGLLGFALFNIPWIVTIYKAFKSNDTLSYLEKSSLASLIVYLICSAYYGGINLYEYNFSGVEVLAFINLGIVSRKLFQVKFKVPHIALSSVAIITTAWFVFSAMQWHKLHEILVKDQNVNSKDKIEKLKSIYDFNFLTHFGNTSLDLTIADMYAKSDEPFLGEPYYNILLSIDPYDCDGLLAYSQYKNEIVKEHDQALKLALKAYAIQNTHSELNLHLADLYLTTNDLAKAQLHFNKVKAKDIKNSSDYLEIQSRLK